MKTWLIAAATLAAASAIMPAAWANGPRASSEHNWTDPSVGQIAAMPPAAAPMMAPVVAPQPVAAPHYVWEAGYENGGKWHGHWVLVP